MKGGNGANGRMRNLMEDTTDTSHHQSMYKSADVVQVNIPAESGEMGILANHVPSIEQLKPGLVEVIEESGGSKQFFRTFPRPTNTNFWLIYWQFLEDLLLCNQTRL